MDKSPCTTTGLRHNFGAFASKYNFNESYHLWLQQQYDMASDTPTELVTLWPVKFPFLPDAAGSVNLRKEQLHTRY
jgi:hypothetical protein